MERFRRNLNLPKRKTADEIAWGSSGNGARYVSHFRRLLGHIEEKGRKLLLALLGNRRLDDGPTRFRDPRQRDLARAQL